MKDGFGKRRTWLLGSAAFMLALGGAAPAFAQDEPVDPDAPTETTDSTEEATANPAGGGEEEILVTGFRAALQSAVSEKRDRDQIVEAVSAEDIGRLPDASIAESIARLPGLAAQRISGRANVISVRGFGPDFSQTLLNGREQTSTGDNRAVEFDQYPSEVVRQVLVYKSPMASLVGQGLVGTIDIRTIRPLDSPDRVFAIGARGSYNDLGALNAGSNETGWRVNATYVDQFRDDTVGIALAASYLDEPYQIQEFNAWGYAGTPAGSVIGGSKSYVTSTQLRRYGLNGTLQVQATPTLRLTLDGFYSHFDDDQIKRGIELPLGFGGVPLTVAGSTDGVVTSGTFTGVEGVVRNDAFERRADLYSFGVNASYEGNNGWNAWVDVGYSRTDRRELILESYSGTGYGGGNGARDTIAFETTRRGTIFDPQLNYSDPNLIVLTDPLGWGGARIQAGYFNDRIVEDELMQFRGEIERELDGVLSGIRFGLNYTNRDKSLDPDESFLLLAGGVSERAIPTQHLLDPTNLDYLGLGPMVSYDPRALLADGIYVLDPNLSPDVLAKGYVVREDLMTAYLQADIEAELGSAVLTGNIGVQATRTDQGSSGFTFARDPDGDIAITPRTLGASFWDILPSLNLSLRFPSNFVIRLALAREIQRPRLDDMRVSFDYSFNVADQIIRGNGGNPFLRPIRANAIDLNIEKYFGNNGYIALQLFYKDLENFIYRDVEQPFDYTGFPLPEGVVIPTLLGTLRQPVNTGGGRFYGAELAGTLPFGVLTDALEGFGITGGLAYTKTRVRQVSGGPLTDIPGYSRWVANGTVYFERWGFSARASVRHRSSFLGELSGFGATRTNRRALGETIVDAQIGYEFQDGSALDGLSLFLQGQNLTDEPFVTISAPDRPLEVIDHQTFGRRFLAGFTFRF